MSVPRPKYTFVQAITAALALAMRAIEEVRAIPAARDGKDGLGFDDMTMEFDGERLMTFRFQRGDQVKNYPFKIQCMIDRGVWREGSFDKGDAVTWGGSLWIAQRDTQDKPETSDAWRLAVKRGRDGKEGPPGKPGLPIPPVQIDGKR